MLDLDFNGPNSLDGANRAINLHNQTATMPTPTDHDNSPSPENPDPRGESKRPEQPAESVPAVDEQVGSKPVEKPAFRTQKAGESDDDYLALLDRYDKGEVDTNGGLATPHGSVLPDSIEPRTILGNTGDDTALQETHIASSNVPGATVLTDTLPKMDEVHALYATRPAVNIPTHGSLEEQAKNVTVYPEDAKNAALHATLYTDPSQEKRDSVEIARAAAAGQGRLAAVPGTVEAVIAPAAPGEGSPAAIAQEQSNPVDLATPEGGVKNQEVVKV